MIKYTLQKAESFIAGFEDDELQEGIPELLAEIRAAMSADYLYSTWHTDDVKERAKDDGYKLTDEQAKDILQIVNDKHDATIGINWDVISCHIDMYAADHKLEEADDDE